MGLFIRTIGIARAKNQDRLGQPRLQNVKRKGGRPPYDPVMMFKILVLQTLYTLSEYQLEDRRSFVRFADLIRRPMPRRSGLTVSNSRGPVRSNVSLRGLMSCFAPKAGWRWAAKLSMIGARRPRLTQAEKDTTSIERSSSASSFASALRESGNAVNPLGEAAVAHAAATLTFGGDDLLILLQHFPPEFTMWTSTKGNSGSYTVQVVG
jgi:hypothetical protein